MHLFESDVHLISKLFKEKYGQELIGESMTQFHNDFDGFEGSVGKIYSRKLIALVNHCRRLSITVEDLYMKLLTGVQVEFNLLDGSNCFRKNTMYQQTNMLVFKRKVSF